MWKSQYLSLFQDSAGLAIGRGAVNLTESIARISFDVFVRGVNQSPRLLFCMGRPLNYVFRSKIWVWPPLASLSWLFHCGRSCLFFDRCVVVVSPQMKDAVIFHISSTVLGVLSFNLLINSGLVIPCMKPEIHMHSGAPFTCMLSALKCSTNATVDSPSLCLMWWISTGSIVYFFCRRKYDKNFFHRSSKLSILSEGS